MATSGEVFKGSIECCFGIKARFKPNSQDVEVTQPLVKKQPFDFLDTVSIDELIKVAFKATIDEIG